MGKTFVLSFLGAKADPKWAILNLHATVTSWKKSEKFHSLTFGTPSDHFQAYMLL